MADRAAPTAIEQQDGRECHSHCRRQSRRLSAPVVSDRPAPLRCALRLAGRRQLRQEAKNSGAEVSFLSRPIPIDAKAQSGLAPENLTTLLHFSVSSAMSLPKSAGESESAVAPKSANRAFSLGSARTELISLLSLSTISADVFLGATTPYHPLAS